MKSLLLAALLGPSLVCSQSNLFSLYLGAWDSYDIRYDRYFANLGVGISPSLGTVLYSKVFWNSGYSELTWYTPTIHLSYRIRMNESDYLSPEIKFLYSYWSEFGASDRKRKTMTLYAALPRLSYTRAFDPLHLGVYAGFFGYTLHNWNANALAEYRPLPIDGFDFWLPALGVSAGYGF